MSRQRAPMAPPELAGYRFQRNLGSGGYADVYLYQQELPQREVAVKVLLAGALDETAWEAFTREANTMAALSAHPFIVTIFQAGVSADDRPYLVMEYYPGPNFAERVRAERFTVAEVLRVGVQLCSAVETAHRSGVLHRDIKPANVLVSEYGRPGLTDFGIAAATGQGSEAEGMSVPWSPPEIVSGSGQGDERADVYSVGATLFTLLAGRSPFEEPGGSNRNLDLVHRITTAELTPVGRPDVPESLERLLRHALAKDPQRRPASAEALARALQDVEGELNLAATPIEVRGGYVAPTGGAYTPVEDRTRLKAPTVIQSQRVSEVTGPLPAAPSLADAGTVPRLTSDVRFVPPMPTGADTPVGFEAPAAPTGAPAPVPASPPRTIGPTQIAAAFVAIVAVLLVVRLLVGLGDDSSGPSTTTVANSGDEGVGGDPAPSAVAVPPEGLAATPQPDGTVTVAWTSPRGADLMVRVRDDGAALVGEADASAGSVAVPQGSCSFTAETMAVGTGDLSDPMPVRCP